MSAKPKAGGPLSGRDLELLRVTVHRAATDCDEPERGKMLDRMSQILALADVVIVVEEETDQ